MENLVGWVPYHIAGWGKAEAGWGKAKAKQDHKFMTDTSCIAWWIFETCSNTMTGKQ